MDVVSTQLEPKISATDDIVKTLVPLVNAEMERAAAEHGTTFASSHEAYAVILEEYKEAKCEGKAVKDFIDAFWGSIRVDSVNFGMIEGAYSRALCAAAEWIQVAGVCKKALGLNAKCANCQYGFNGACYISGFEQARAASGVCGGEYRLSYHKR